MISKEQHVSVFDLEIKTQLKEWEVYVHKKFNVLLAEKKKELFLGRIISINHDGAILIRCKKGTFPRLNWQYYFRLVGPDVKGDPSNWNFTFLEYKDSENPRYSLAGGSNGVVIRFAKSDEEWVYFNAIMDDNKFIEFVENRMLNKGIQPIISISKSYPPLDYLKNLKAYVEKSNNQILKYTRNENNWNPVNLANNEINESFLIQKLLADKLIVIQGPPGTGKSYQAALICKSFLRQNKSVVICALTNRALIEIASQPGIKELLALGIVFKTNCSRSEAKELPGLLDAQKINIHNGSVILTTYYKLSSFKSPNDSSNSILDLLIIEEASQAFLSTLAMFSEMAEHTLIIGDQMQLPPVVQSSQEDLSRIHLNVNDLIEGFDTLTWNVKTNLSYRFAQTRRLTDTSAKLTGIFYDNKLQSCSPLNTSEVNSGNLADLFGPMGGVNIVKIPLGDSNHSKKDNIFDKIVRIVKTINTFSPESSISILSFKVEYEQKMIESLQHVIGNNTSILVSTVHRVQGITTDYTVYLMPLEEVDLELNSKLFNVATSRAKKGTLLVTFDFIKHTELNPIVRKFLSLCNDVTESFINLKT
jgi:DNA replication ATP-dependent helicase Dna2